MLRQYVQFNFTLVENVNSEWRTSKHFFNIRTVASNKDRKAPHMKGIHEMIFQSKNYKWHQRCRLLSEKRKRLECKAILAIVNENHTQYIKHNECNPYNEWHFCLSSWLSVLL